MKKPFNCAWCTKPLNDHYDTFCSSSCKEAYLKVHRESIPVPPQNFGRNSRGFSFSRPNTRRMW